LQTFHGAAGPLMKQSGLERRHPAALGSDE